mmetsp:Transcript_20086/g.46804  ORF Transcript_20086/g.46804 Transcript_20086/m.46804 type:complete len:457 (+) Transcript_20086:77-1447(+)
MSHDPHEHCAGSCCGDGGDADLGHSVPVPSRGVLVALDDIKFSAAHFVAFNGFREPVHGHNYTVSLRVGGNSAHGESLGADGYIVDFGDLKKAARKAARALNQKILIPTKSDVLQVQNSTAAPNHIEIRCEDGAFITLPVQDCALVPIVHTTAEELSEHIWYDMMQNHGLGPLLLDRRAGWLQVSVSERPGQTAHFCQEISKATISSAPSRRRNPRPCFPGENRPREASSPRRKERGATTAPAPAPSVAGCSSPPTPNSSVGPSPLEEAEAAFRKLLDSLPPEEASRSELIKTPKRAAKAFHEMTQGLHIADARDAVGEGVFSLPNENSDPVAVRDIPFNSLCEHHLLPFAGVAHIAYIPSGRVLGLSKFARLLKVLANRLQLQERLTQQFADTLVDILSPQALMVTMEAHHTCMSARGAQSPANTKSIAFRGPKKDDPAVREILVHAVSGGRSKM